MLACRNRLTCVQQNPRYQLSRKSVKISASTIVIKPIRKTLKQKQAEQELMDALEGIKGRGQKGVDEEKSKRIDEVIQKLEDDGGVKAPTKSQYLNGKWKLLFTSKPGTESPIQRTFTGVDAFQVYQEIDFLSEQTPTVTNVVDFGERIGNLRVAALGSIDSRPLPDFVPRQGEGLPIFGKSLTYPPADQDMRIDFQFDNAAFKFTFLPFKIPYPVPFRRLGDEVKGWLDVTYLSPDGLYRISRGNKGTLFVLQRDIPMQDKIVQAVAKLDEDAILNLVEELINKGEQIDAKSDLRSQGKWRLIWSQQSSTATSIQRILSNQVDNFQIVEGTIGRGKIQNLVNIFPVFKFRLDADCEYVSKNRVQLRLNFLRIELFGLNINLRQGGGGKEDDTGYLDVLYLDNDIRVSRGSKGSLFVHVREEYYDGSTE
eukprot:TRINITY_DN8468_c0_g1_i2.p1 TRINITY_DN8468_c0_g1~~TRINITY_DN8468_c0_g1_i2.p1  ORF type:complete len:429 (-),score=38.15 TRINITY_DN8468_c0_g1_i2:235-1521(-)